MTPADLKRLKELEAKASPGPWRSGEPERRCVLDHDGRQGNHGRGQCVYGFRGWRESVCGAAIYRDTGPLVVGEVPPPEAVPLIAGQWDYDYGGFVRVEDADLAAAARNALPWLLARLEWFESFEGAEAPAIPSKPEGA